MARRRSGRPAAGAGSHARGLRRSAAAAGVVLLSLGLAVAAIAAPLRTAPELQRSVRLATRTFPDTLSVGDRVTLEVDVEAPETWQVRFPDRLRLGNAAELVGVEVVPPGAARGAKARKSAAPAGKPGTATWTGRYRIAVFEVGDVVLPPWPVEVRAESLQTVASTDSIRLFVHSVLDTTLAGEGLRDLKAQVTIPVSPWPWILGALALVLLVAGILWWRRRRRVAPVVPIARLRPAHEVALEALRRLETRKLPVDGKFEEHHVRLSEILRRYLEDGFGVAALEETSEEILLELDRRGFDRATVRQVGSLCAESDLVKFAKHAPTVEECVRSLENVREFVLATTARSQQAEESAARAIQGGEPA